MLQKSDFVYTADSKLCTDANLRHVAFYGGRYITVIPRTWKEDESFRELVREDKVRWRLILKRPNNRQPDTVVDKYYTTTTNYHTKTGRRLVWIRSTEKAAIDQEARTKQIDKTLTALKLLNTKLNKYKLKRLPAIKCAVKEILAAHQIENYFDFSIRKHIVATKSYLKRGRLKANTIVKIHRRMEYQLSWEMNQEEVDRQARTDRVFPLLTNIMDKSAREILETNKYQSFLENRHS